MRYSFALLLLGVASLLPSCSRSNGSSEGELVLSGNIEVTDAQLGFKTAGRVSERLLSEGETAKAGQLLARLEDTEQCQQLELRRAELAAAEAVLAELEAGSRPQEISAAEATLRSVEAERERARLDFSRQQELRKREVIAERDFETAEAQLKVAEAKASEAAERLKLVREGARAETINQARARVRQAKAAVAVAEIQLSYTRLLSPMEGVVTSHSIEPGEFVSPGTPVLTLADLARPWVRAYVAQTDFARVRHGQKVIVRTDSLPGIDLEGVVGFIASEAEFTPKSVQTTKERVKLVYRIKVYVSNPKGELKTGMPVDVIVPAGN